MDYRKLLKLCLYDRETADYFSRLVQVPKPTPVPLSPKFLSLLQQLKNPVFDNDETLEKMRLEAISFTEKMCTFEHAMDNHMCHDFLVIQNMELADTADTFKEKLIVWNNVLRITQEVICDFQTLCKMHSDMVKIGSLTDWMIAFKYFKPADRERFNEMATRAIVALLEKEIVLENNPNPALEIDPTYQHKLVYP